ncbi:hypothetical protein [Streptomyces sp. NPDC059881]|uniref:hypothetical protein n=1 Tax=Streptomyces sp. NPDC059881 TaxID=3346986 RepID=UPI0036539EAD
MPERYGPWARSYDLFRRWQRDGTWQRIFAQLQVRPTPENSSPGTSVSAPPSGGPTSTPPERGKGDLQQEPPGCADVEPDDHGPHTSSPGSIGMLLVKGPGHAADVEGRAVRGDPSGPPRWHEDPGDRAQVQRVVADGP